MTRQTKKRRMPTPCPGNMRPATKSGRADKRLEPTGPPQPMESGAMPAQAVRATVRRKRARDLSRQYPANKDLQGSGGATRASTRWKQC